MAGDEYDLLLAGDASFARRGFGPWLFYSDAMIEKKTEQVTIWLPESLKVDLMHLAADCDRKFSDYLRHALALHAYGHSRPAQCDAEAQMRGDSPR